MAQLVDAVRVPFGFCTALLVNVAGPVRTLLHRQLLRRSRRQQRLAQAGSHLGVTPRCSRGLSAEACHGCCRTASGCGPRAGALAKGTGQDAGQRCTSRSHQVLREGLPPAIPEGVHKYFVVLDGNRANSGVQVKCSPAAHIAPEVSMAAPQHSSTAGHYVALQPCKTALVNRVQGTVRLKGNQASSFECLSAQMSVGVPLRQNQGSSPHTACMALCTTPDHIALLTERQSHIAFHTDTCS